MTAKDQAVAVALAVAVAVMVAVGYALLPFTAAGGLECEAPLRGSDPKPDQRTAGFVLGREKGSCGRAGNGRLLSAGVAGMVFLGLGVGAAVLPESRMEKVLFDDEDVIDLYS